MLLGWKNMHSEQHYVAEQFDLYEHMDDPAYKERVEVFDSWYENPLDLPGRWYLQAIRELFKENRLAKGEFVGLGRRLNLKSIGCPLYLLAGESDDITTRSRFSRRRTSSEPGKVGSRRSWSPADTSVSSWARARSRRRGRRSRGG